MMITPLRRCLSSATTLIFARCLIIAISFSLSFSPFAADITLSAITLPPLSISRFIS
jgi:hypothetical protein